MSQPICEGHTDFESGCVNPITIPLPACVSGIILIGTSACSLESNMLYINDMASSSTSSMNTLQFLLYFPFNSNIISLFL